MAALNYPYQYVVLRCVPRADREEFVNIGVVLYCQALDFLRVHSHVDAGRLAAVAPGIDIEAVRRGLAHAEAVCAGTPSAGQVADSDLGTRFGYLKAPRSTVVRPGPVHGGVTPDPELTLTGLLDRLVRT